MLVSIRLDEDVRFGDICISGWMKMLSSVIGIYQAEWMQVLETVFAA